MRRRHYRYGTRLAQADGLEPLTALWVWRMLVPLGGHKQLLEKHGFEDDALAAVLEAEVGRVPQLTPGDFAAVARRHGFSPIGSADALLRRKAGGASPAAPGPRLPARWPFPAASSAPGGT